MSTFIGIGFSQATDTFHAAREAALQAKTQSKQQEHDCAIVFATIHYNPLETLHSIRQTLPKAKIIGCSTCGIILSESTQMRGIAVLVIKSKVIKFGISSISNITPHTMQIAGTELARRAISDFGEHRRQAFLFFADGLLQNSSLIVKGIQSIFGKIFPVIGAGSSDNFRFDRTYQYFQDKALQNSAVALLIGGQSRFVTGSKHAWKPLGKPRFATKTESNIICTINDKKASLLYEEYFDLTLKELCSTRIRDTTMLYPLGIRAEGEKEYLLRYAVDITTNGSIICQEGVPEGSEVHLMISNKDFCKQAALQAAREVQDGLLGKQPKLVITFESISHYKLLGRNARQITEVIKEVLGQKTPIIGMYSYGEISPVKSITHTGEPYLQNGSIVIAGIA